MQKKGDSSMKKQPHISIITPAYNTGHFLHETIDSILKQTHQNWDFYCCNDGSTDNTLDVLERYAKQDKRIHVFSHENKGLTKTLNFLLDKIEKTDYLYFLDSDDYIHPQIFEILTTIQQKTQADVVECGSVRVKDKKPIEYYKTYDINTLHIDVQTDMTPYLLRRTRKNLSNGWINKWNKIYVWDKVKNLRYNENLSYEDDFFYNQQAHTMIETKAVINIPLYYWRINVNSTTGNVNWEKYQSATASRIYASYDYFIRDNRLPNEIKTEFMKDLTQDAYRMVGLKPICRCKDAQLRHKLFLQAGELLNDMIQKNVILPALMNPYKRFVLWSIRKKLYYLTRLLLVIK